MIRLFIIKSRAHAPNFVFSVLYLPPLTALIGLDYGSGQIIADLEPERQNTYISCVQVRRRGIIL
jgi:hypothetical protein